MSKVPIWIDSDCGVDDSVALFAAFKLENAEIKGISAVAGNVEEEKTFLNIRNIAHMAKRNDIKVYHGAEKPLILPLETAKHVHGENGLGDIIIEESQVPHETEKAWDVLYRVAKECNGELVVITLGPSTNIAIALGKYPDLEKYIKRILMMGGAVIGGNATPCAEFNVFADPHGAEVVFKSNIEKVMFGLDVTLKAYIDLDDIEEIKEHGSVATNYFYKAVKRSLKFYEEIGMEGKTCMHDTCPVLYVGYPELFSGEVCGVYVETEGKVTMGKTVCDIESNFKFDKRDTLVIFDVDQQKFAAKVKEIVKSI